MKKIFYLFGFSIVCFLVYSRVCMAAQVNEQFTKTFISGYSFVDTTGHYGNFEYFKRKSDGKIAYCIQPGVSMSNGVYEGFYDLSLEEKASRVQLSREQLKEMSLIAYFGWGYNNHFGNDWIVATQTLIWKVAGRDFQFTSRNNPTDPWKYVIGVPGEIDSHMKEIENLITNYKSTPHFLESHAQIPVGNSYDYLDSSNQLSSYSVRSCENCQASITGNVLTVTPTSLKGGKVLLEKGETFWNSDFIVYYSSEGQNMMVPGDVSTIESSVSFEVFAGQVEIKKVDQKTKTCKSRGDATLVGAVYGLYTLDGNLVQNLVINKECMALSERNLNLGDYYLQEIKAPRGYKLDLEKHYFSVTKENASHVIFINVSDEVYETFLTINKTYLVQNDIVAEEGAEFGIYLKSTNKKIDTLVIDKDGVANVTLPFGEYIIKQEKGREGYLFVEDIIFFVKEDTNKNTYLTLLNQPYRGSLHFLKIDASTLKPLADAFIEVYDINDHLVYRGYTDLNGEIFVDPLVFGQYYLVEKKAPDGYALSSERVYFTIFEDKQEVYLTLENEQEVEVPNTLANSYSRYYFFVSILFLLGVIFIYYEKKDF